MIVVFQQFLHLEDTCWNENIFAGLCEFYRVWDEVEQDLLESIFVASQLWEKA